MAALRLFALRLNDPCKHVHGRLELSQKLERPPLERGLREVVALLAILLDDLVSPPAEASEAKQVF
jgi:hypothetical protein